MQTLAQKLVARAAGRASATPGEIDTGKVDLAMMHGSGGPRRVKPTLERLGAKVWDPARGVVITDHYLPAHDAESRKIIEVAREWVREAGIRALPMRERMTLANMTAELGGQAGLIASDEVTREHLRSAGVPEGAVNLGLPALACRDAKRIRAADRLRVDAEAGRTENETTGETLACEPIPPRLLQMVRDGGLLPHLEKRLGKRHDTA